MLSNLGPNHKRLQRLLESLGLTRSSFSCPNYSQCKQKKKDRSGKKCNSRLHFLIFQLIFPLLLCYRRKSFAWLFSPPFVIYNAEFIFRPPLSLSSILWKGEVCDDDDDDTIFIHFKMSTSLKKSQTTKEESFLSLLWKDSSKSRLMHTLFENYQKCRIRNWKTDNFGCCFLYYLFMKKAQR